MRRPAGGFFRGSLERKRTPAYLLSGDGAGLCGLFAESWLERFRAEGTTAELFHWTVLDMERGRATAAWRTPSFFARERVYLLPDLAEMKKAMRDETVAYLEAPDPGVVLVIPCTDRKLAASFGSRPGVTALALREDEAVATLAARAVAIAEKAGARLSADAASFLVWWVGLDDARLKEEVGKLAAFAGARGVIGEEEIRQVCVARGGVDAFALAEALLARNAAACVEMTRRFTASAESADYHALVGAIAWKTRMGLGGRGALAPARAGKILSALARIDRGMKGGSGLTNAQLLEVNLLKLLA